MDIFSKKKKNDNSFDEGFKFAFFSFFSFFNATLLSSSREISLVNGNEALRNRRYGNTVILELAKSNSPMHKI